MAAIITPKEVPNYVPGAVTAASDNLGWNGVWLRGYRYTALDVIVPPVSDFTIVSYLRGATLMERRCEGAWTRTYCAPGDVSLLTRSQRSHWHWTEEIDVSHVYLSESLVSGICAEVTDRSIADVRLQDVVKTHDPIVTAAVAAITGEVQQQAVAACTSKQRRHSSSCTSCANTRVSRSANGPAKGGCRRRRPAG